MTFKVASFIHPSVTNNNTSLVIQCIIQPVASTGLFHQPTSEERIDVCLRLVDAKIKLLKVADVVGVMLVVDGV